MDPTTTSFVRDMVDPTPDYTGWVALGLLVVLVWLLWFKLKLRRWLDYAFIFYGTMLLTFIAAVNGYYTLFNVAFPAWWIGFFCVMMHIRSCLPDDGRRLD